MKKFLNLKEMTQEEILLYSLLGIVILTTSLFLIIYLIWVPFWPARIMHTVYLLFNVFLVYLVTKEKFLFAKVGMLISNLFQLALACFLWFPLTTRYELFYFLLPMGSFAIFNLLIPKERNIALSVTLLSFILFFMNSFMDINFYMFELSNIATKIISFLTITSTMGILAFYFYLHSFFLSQRRLELEYLANTDGLTNLLNRRRFYSLSELEFDLAYRHNKTFTLLLLDVDNFKNINDTYGHDIGDYALKTLSATVTKNIRKNDIFARHGGEEFTLLLRDTDSETGIKTAEKIRKCIEDIPIETDLGDVNITVSIGVVQFSRTIKSFDKLLQHADKALYKAKENGKNCIHYKDVEEPINIGSLSTVGGK